ncbi:MAG: hypothetical protein H7831_08360 [Magnetococcus sp. WYHC-3]
MSDRVIPREMTSSRVPADVYNTMQQMAQVQRDMYSEQVRQYDVQCANGDYMRIQEHTRIWSFERRE